MNDNTMDEIRGELRIIRTELQHNRELCEQRIAQLERQSTDHETRLRDVTAGVTQFRLWSSITSGGSAALSLGTFLKTLIH